MSLDDFRPHQETAMLLGPVFHAELLATSRRRRFYATRVVYGLLLLLLLAQANIWIAH